MLVPAASHSGNRTVTKLTAVHDTKWKRDQRAVLAGRGTRRSEEHVLPVPFPPATDTPGRCLGLQNLKQAGQQQLTLAEHCLLVRQSSERLM